MKKRILSVMLALAAFAGTGAFRAGAQEILSLDRLPILRNMANSPKVMLDSAALADPSLKERVIVGNDTVSVILPQKNYGRYDRGLFNYLFIPKGQWSFGLMASYGEFNTDDIQILGLIKNLDLSLKAYSIQPSISYFFSSNQSMGLKFNYVRMEGDLPSFSVNFSDDIDFSLKDISYYQQSFSTSLTYRNYIGLGSSRRFAVFNEVDLAFGSGSSRFRRLYGGKMKDTRTNFVTSSLNFSPGVCVFIMDYVSFNVSFGVFGLNVRNERQWTDGKEDGSRFTSGANFRFNIFNINFGMAVYI